MQSTSKEAFAAEGTLQRQLARKLGIKGKKRKAAPLPETDAVEELDTLFAGLRNPGWCICSVGVTLNCKASPEVLRSDMYSGSHHLSSEQQVVCESTSEVANS